MDFNLCLKEKAGKIILNDARFNCFWIYPGGRKWKAIDVKNMMTPKRKHHFWDIQFAQHKCPVCT